DASSMDRVGRLGSNLALLFGLAPVSDQEHKQLKMPRWERLQRAEVEELVEFLQRSGTALLLGAFPPAVFDQRRIHLENRGPKLLESRIQTFDHCHLQELGELKSFFRPLASPPHNKRWLTQTS